MDRSKKQTKNFIFWVLLFGITLLCVWRTQRAVPVMMDDDWYSTILSDDRPLQSWGDIVQAQIWHYQNWGGRTVAHAIDQAILLYLSPPAADILNTVLIVLLAWLIDRTAGERRLSFLTLTIGFLHGLNANWKMSMYWQTGACNYLYTTILILIFLHFYLRELDRPGQALTHGSGRGEIPGFFVITALLGLLCGWTNENMGPAVWLMTLAVTALLKREQKRIPLWMVTGSVGCLTGSLLMILAPGNRVRSVQVASSEYGLLWQIFLRCYSVCKGAWEYLFPAILVTAGLLVLNLCILGNHLRRQDGVLLVGALLSWGAMVLSPHYPDRAAFGTMCLLLCVAVSQAAAILKTRESRLCTVSMAAMGIFIWLRGMFFLGEFLSISWGWIR